MLTAFTALCGRRADSASDAWNVVKTLVQIVLFWGFFLIVVPLLICHVEEMMSWQQYRFTSPIWRAVGTVLFLMMSSLGLICAATMVFRGKGTPLPADCTRALVVTGPYRYVRNPMAIAGLTQGLAVALYIGSPLVLFYALAGMIGWNYLVRPWEERDLELRFGESYTHYRRAVRCWIPHRRGYDPDAN